MNPAAHSSLSKRDSSSSSARLRNLCCCCLSGEERDDHAAHACRRRLNFPFLQHGGERKEVVRCSLFCLLQERKRKALVKRTHRNYNEIYCTKASRMHGVQHAAGEEKLSAHEFFMQRRKKKRRRAHDDVRRERGHTELLLHLRRRAKSVHKSYHRSRRAAQCFLLVPAFVEERLLSLACREIFLLLHAVVRICKTLPHTLSLSILQLISLTRVPIEREK